ncbi:putative internalin [Enhygromyxa salina]|uniref:Putative internalin n=1 Tax=Enhygromyxa salina TaxID=215803 RepID=A0A0C2D091_9BACT|nr:MYXO-CTERM sorting domain-containing protein [Enhygromyxa salina]KIG15240.1 putative internalin [Enhygromyxa salina]
MQPRRLVLSAFGVTVLALALAAPAQASELRFSVTAKGGVVSTGNTLGLSKQPAANGPGVGDSIGTFLSPDAQQLDTSPANLGNPWGPGTTSSWALNGSSAVLDLPQSSTGVEVLYAELVWGGSYNYGTENVSADLDVPVTLAANGMTFDAVPSPQTAVTLAGFAAQGFAVNYYMRSADVTAFVIEQESATYTVTGVPATQDFSIEQLNAAGWTLVVVYRSSDAPTRNLTVFVGGQFVDEDATEDYPVSGFCTPPAGTVEGGVVISAIEGDANRTGDTFQIAPTGNGPFASLSGPNNPVDNFFASQINGVDGQLDTQGSAGDANHDAFAGVNVVGGRQGWDITKLPLSSAANQLSAGQTSAVLRAVTTGDSFMPVLAAFEIDVSSPDFQDGNSANVSPQEIGIGDQTTITFELLNEGDVSASDLMFTAPLGQGLELVSFAVDDIPGDVNQQAVTTGDLVSGVELGNIAAGSGREVTMVVEAVGQPLTPDGWFLVATWAYDYVSCVGEDPLNEQSVAFADIDFAGGGDGDGDGDPGDGDGDTADSGADAGTGSDEGGGDGGTDGGTDGADTSTWGETGGGPGLGDGDGCNCQAGPNSPNSPASMLALLGLLGLLRNGHRSRRCE